VVQVLFNQERIQKQIAQLFHCGMIIRFGHSKGEALGKYIQKESILANIKFEVRMWQRTVSQGHDKRMFPLTLPERKDVFTQAHAQ
jgi:hypothetical protein